MSKQSLHDEQFKITMEKIHNQEAIDKLLESLMDDMQAAKDFSHAMTDMVESQQKQIHELQEVIIEIMGLLGKNIEFKTQSELDAIDPEDEVYDGPPILDSYKNKRFYIWQDVDIKGADNHEI